MALDITSGIIDIPQGGTNAGTAPAARVNLLPALAGNANKILAVNAGATDVEYITPTAGGTGLTFTVVTANTTAVNQQGLIANTTAGSFTITLPASPTLGMQVVIADGGNWAVNNLTVARNGSTIDGLAEDLVVNIGNILLTFVYGTSTWELYAQAGVASNSGSSTVNIVSTNTTAEPFKTYSLISSVTLTLPASPASGDWVKISNRSGTVTPVVGRNAQNIMGLAEDMILNNIHAGITLVFADSTRGWILI